MTTLQWIQAASPFAIAIAGFIYSYVLAQRQTSADAQTSDHLRRIDSITQTTSEFISLMYRLQMRIELGRPNIDKSITDVSSKDFDRESEEGDIVEMTRCMYQIRILLSSETGEAHRELENSMRRAITHAQDQFRPADRDGDEHGWKRHAEIITDKTLDVIKYEKSRAENAM